MSDTTATLRRKITGAFELQSVVRTMKAIAASSIGQYEQSVRALNDYQHTVALGLGACFRKMALAPLMTEQKIKKETDEMDVIVFGSDQGLVGQFNDVVVEYAVKTLATLPGKPRIWAIGERVQARLIDAGLSPRGLFSVPTSVKAITPFVGKILLENEARHDSGAVSELHLFYNHTAFGAAVVPTTQRLLPLDESWHRKQLELSWPTKSLPKLKRRWRRP